MIDWSRVEELHEEVGEEDFVEIVGLFLEEMRDSVEVLDTLGPGRQLSEALHGIKGSALNLGFTAVSDLCASGERNPGSFDIACLRGRMVASVDALTERYNGVL